MNKRVAIHHLGLKSKILLFVGVFFTILILGMSFFMLVQWRTLIIDSKIQRTEDVTKALSINILNALIFSEENNVNIEDQLEDQVADFKEKITDIKFISVLDNENNLLASSDFSIYSTENSDSNISIYKTAKLISSIYNHKKFGWIINSILPLQIGGKRWGVLEIGMDANPLQSEIRTLFFVLSASTLLSIIILLSIAYFSINRITSSFYELTKLLDEINYEIDELKEFPQRNDEIGFLIQHVNALQVRLMNSRNQLINAQKQIYHAEKLASIGRLASGVAHEINNPLNGIKSCLYSINKNPNDKKQNEEYLELINEGVNHIETIVRKLLGFAHQHSKAIENIDISEIINKVIRLLDFQINRKQIKLIFESNSDLPTIKADLNLIQEVIMNLLLNAIDAVKVGGKINVGLSLLTNECLEISIEDNGEGIPKDKLGTIFEPFFTTKEEGQGTGLGLSVSLGIIESHGGNISVESKQNESTIFRINLPLESRSIA